MIELLKSRGGLSYVSCPVVELSFWLDEFVVFNIVEYIFIKFNAVEYIYNAI